MTTISPESPPRAAAHLFLLGPFGREHDNLQAALGWALRPEADAAHRLAGLRLAAALAFFWYTRGYGREGRRWLGQALALAPAGAPAQAAAKAHAAAGTMAWLLGDFDVAVAHHQAALAGYRSSEDDRGAAWALGNLAVCVNDQAEHDRALKLYA